MTLDALLFDKDGTLFDFDGTWNVWTAEVIATLSEGDPAIAARIAEVARFDLTAQCYLPDSPIIAGTNREAAELMASALPGHDVDALEAYLMASAAEAPLVPAVALHPFLTGLLGQNLKLGVMTNDSEFSALRQLEAAEVRDLFHFIAGFDSGHGAKPAPEPLLAFCSAVDIAPARTAMIGDSTHDLVAGRAAGMITVGVLTGPADVAELAPYADVVLPDIGHIPAWLSERSGDQKPA